jgi:hypothetical protein
LQTNGSGTLSFANLAIANGGTGVTSFAANQIHYGSFSQSANLTFNGTTLTSTGFAGPLNGTVGATTANTGAFTTLSATGTLSGGTSGTGYSFSGSAPAGSLTLDSSGNLGLGVTPSAWGSIWKAQQFQVGGFIASQTNANDIIHIGTNAFSNSSNAWTYINSTFSTRYQQYQGAHSWYNAPSGTAGNAITFTQAMTLDASGNLLVGTTTITTNQGKGLIVGNSSGGNISIGTNGQAGGGTPLYTDLSFRGYQNAETARIRGLDNSGTLAQGVLQFYTASLVGTDITERMRIDSSGNLGLGVTPSAWGSSYRAFEMASAGLMSNTNGGSFFFMNNAYYNGTNWIYKYTQLASRYDQSAGVHSWYNAPSGTAGNAITFTQAMTLDASGNLGVGTTSTFSAYTKGHFASGISMANNATDGGVLVGATTTGTELAYLSMGRNYNLASSGEIALATGSAKAILFGTNNTERARIDSSGNLLVGTTSSTLGSLGSIFGGSAGSYESSISVAASGNVPLRLYNKGTSGTQYFMEFRTASSAVGSITYNQTVTLFNTTSDYRLKTVVGPVTDSGSRIDALQPVEYTWNSNGTSTRGFLAHQFQEVYAGSVSGTKDALDANGKPKYQAMQAATSEVIADLVAEIQSLRKRLTALEST